MRDSNGHKQEENLNDHKIIGAGILCFFSFLLFYGLTARSNVQISDEVAMAATGVSLATDGDLAIDEWQWLQDAITIGQIGRGEHLYSKYFPGNIYSFAAVYRLMDKQNDTPYLWSAKDLNATIPPTILAPSNRAARFALKINAFYGALGMTALFFLLNRYFDWKTTVVTVLLTGLSTDWWYQSRGFTSEVGAGAFLIASLCFMAYQRPYASSLMLGISILFRPTSLLALPIWGKAVWKKVPETIFSGVLIIAALLLLAYYNWARFGSVATFGYGVENFTSNWYDGLYGLLLSPGRSLFVYSPILTLAIPGTFMLYKKEKSVALVSVAIVVSHVFVIALWHSWDGGWSWGSRLLTPIIPVLGFLTAAAVEYAWQKRGDMFVVIILAMLGTGVQLLALARDPMKTIVESVVYGDIKYEETVLSINHSWIAIQIKSLQHWQICDLDAYTLRQWFGDCPQ